MVTENGSIKARTLMDGNMQKEFFRNAYRTVLALIIVGAAGAGVFLIAEIVSIFLEIEDGFFEFIIVFGVMLGLGIAFRIILNSGVKNVAALPKLNEYEFFSDYFTVDQSLNGENLLHNKIYNNQITKSKETKNYLFFYVGTNAFPVMKAELPEEELNALRKIFRLPVHGNAVALSAENTHAESTDNENMKEVDTNEKDN